MVGERSPGGHAASSGRARSYPEGRSGGKCKDRTGRQVCCSDDRESWLPVWWDLVIVKRSILILCSSFYPRNTPGAHRVAKMAKYLPEFGWTPVVLCPDWNSVNDPWYQDPGLIDRDPCEVVRVPYPVDNRTKMRKAWLVYSGRFFPHLAPFALRRAMQNRGMQLLHERKFDLLLASCPPTVVLTVAHGLAGAFGLPLVVDFRDIPDELGPRLSLTRRREMGLQTALCRGARGLTTVSAPLADRLASRNDTPVHVILNGYDPEDFPAPEPRAQPAFDIVYCGGLTDGRHPGPLLAALDRMIGEDGRLIEKARVCFYGALERQLKELTQGRRCRSLIHNMGRIPHAQNIRVQQQAAVLLLLSHRQGLGVMTSKVFEYLGAGRLILSVPGDGGVTDALLHETQAGVVAPTPGEIARILRGWLDEWRRTGRVTYRGRADRIEQYTRRNQTSRLAEILNRIVEPARAATVGSVVH